MSKEKLKSMILDSVQSCLGNGYHVSLTETLKNNSLKLTGIIIQKKGGNIAPVIYIDNLMESYEAEASPDAIADKIIGIYVKNSIAEQFDISRFAKFETCKNMIIFQLVNTERNASLLETIPSVKFLDFSIIFKILIEQDTGQAATATITNNIMSFWNVSTDTLYKTAMTNTPFLQKYTLKSMGDVLIEITGDDVLADFNEMYVLTNSQSYCGCGCILYPHLMKKFADSIGMDFYILPSSIHEVLLIPAYGKDVLSLIQIVREVNRTAITQEEFLSDNVYYYSREDKAISMFQ